MLIKDENDYIKLYNSFLSKKELNEFFPDATGNWKEDSVEFKRLYSLFGVDDVTNEEDEENDFEEEYYSPI